MHNTKVYRLGSIVLPLALPAIHFGRFSDVLWVRVLSNEHMTCIYSNKRKKQCTLIVTTKTHSQNITIPENEKTTDSKPIKNGNPKLA